MKQEVHYNKNISEKNKFCSKSLWLSKNYVDEWSCDNKWENILKR